MEVALSAEGESSTGDIFVLAAHLHFSVAVAQVGSNTNHVSYIVQSQLGNVGLHLQ